ncbi:hypothetical protein K0M31_002263 [Melipona bicolor]|uniref:Uncharacterized protein n=1 Tax=Melipona bicolor TaxID=60889 RepID=A0AA40GHX2_9HYME|nr:hypothetical protein K0M31_002263 [Melipona bicolor]
MLDRSDNAVKQGEVNESFSWEEVSAVMKCMKNGKTTGGDGICIEFSRLCQRC